MKLGVPHYGVLSAVVDLVRFRPARFLGVGGSILVGKSHINAGDMNSFRVWRANIDYKYSPHQIAQIERGLGSRLIHFSGPPPEGDFPFR